MEIKREQIGTTLVISLKGHLDTNSAPLLHEDLMKNVLDGVKELYWDFSELNYLTSAGIRELLIADNMLGDDAQMKVLHANDAIRNAFNLTGLDSMLGI